MAKIYHSDLYGKRESKYKWLDENSFSSIEWNELNPNSPKYFFIPRVEQFKDIYKSFISIPVIFPINVSGIVTARDKFVIDFKQTSLERRISDFRSKHLADEVLRTTYGLKNTRGWFLSEARKSLRADENWNAYYNKILYRPFDVRIIYYTPIMVDWVREEVMSNMVNNNISLITPRQFKENAGAFVSSNLVGHKTVSAYDINYVFPLYIYPQTDKKDLFSDQESEEKKPNINPELFETLRTTFKKSPRASIKKSKGEFEITPEQIFYYIYAILYSNTYRTKYAEFLKIDFPKVPFTKNYQLFLELGKLGNQLADLHLLKDEAFKTTISKFPIKGTNKVEKPKYKEEKVYINNDQYFDGVKEEIWNYQIGGYQVCEKWLKDRKERPLTLEEIQTYSKIVTALSKTIEIQNQIDELYPKVEKTL